MAVPKKKVSKSRRNQRRAHDSIKKVHIAFDSVTGEPKLPHHVSLSDGYYKGKQMVAQKEKKDKQENSEGSAEAQPPAK